ncbi:hypothetical protein BC827DRAFT_821088 [Russula dissimulans]|nr:hypothetical protein BC827DRAFT_821088 [Russula dissimulans]
MMIRVQATNTLAILVSALSIASVFLTHTLFVFTKNVQFETVMMKKEYSMLGDDWPAFFPLTLERKIKMVVEESVHYAPGTAGGRDEWQYQRGFGFDGAGRLGADNRTFAVSLYHQEHCLLYFHVHLADRRRGGGSTQQEDRSVHHQHCLNYLRQQALCHPDLTLEPGDFATRDFDVDRVGQTHVCRDFETAWDRNTESWLEWYRFWKDSRVSGVDTAVRG